MTNDQSVMCVISATNNNINMTPVSHIDIHRHTYTHIDTQITQSTLSRKLTIIVPLHRYIIYIIVNTIMCNNCYVSCVEEGIAWNAKGSEIIYVIVLLYMVKCKIRMIPL